MSEFLETEAGQAVLMACRDRAAADRALVVAEIGATPAAMGPARLGAWDEDLWAVYAAEVRAAHACDAATMAVLVDAWRAVFFDPLPEAPAPAEPESEPAPEPEPEPLVAKTSRRSRRSRKRGGDDDAVVT